MVCASNGATLSSTSLSFAARCGVLGIVDFECDMVVSGSNQGANIGTDVIYSGTVGAAVGGRKLKYPPIALSVASYETVNMDASVMERIMKDISLVTFKIFVVLSSTLALFRCGT